MEGDAESGIRFRNRYGIVWPLTAPRPPPGRAEALLAVNHTHGLRIDPDTNQHGNYGHFDLHRAVAAVSSAVA